MTVYKNTRQRPGVRLSKKSVGPRVEKILKNRLLFFSSRKASCTLKKIKHFKSRKTAQLCGFCAFCLLLGAVPRGSPKSHMAFWGEEKCTLEVSNRRKKLFKRRLRTYRRAFRRRLPLAKYKIQLAFLAVSQRVGLYILLPLYFFRHADTRQPPGVFYACFSRAVRSPIFSSSARHRLDSSFFHTRK